MLTAVISILSPLGSQHRKVQRYLDEATYDSVPRDLGKALLPQLRGIKERELLQTTFERHCLQDSSRQKYWTEESFRRHVRSTFSAAAISDSAVQLLWRSFQFYAHHPFPRRLQDAKIDYDAFQRAALLTIFQCDDLLGTRESEWFWRNDEAFFRKASFERIFRSIGTPEATTQQSKQQNSASSVVSDAMDVLTMTVPQFIHAGPSPERLEVVAQKLFDGNLDAAQRRVRREHAATLIDLLLRMRLKKEKWAWLYNYGEFADNSEAVEELVDSLINSVVGNESDQTITSEQLLEAMAMIPNLQLRFYQLWAVVFQPPVPTNQPSKAPEAAPACVNAVISLFLPHIKTENRYHQRTTGKDDRFVLEKTQVLSDSPDATILRLSQSLSHNSSACVTLFTGIVVATTQKAVVGAYFPPLAQENGNQETGANTRHLLFQLQPRFRFLPCAGSDVPPSDLIKTEGSKLSLVNVMANQDSKSSNQPYWIRHADGQGAGLRIDPNKRTATLMGGDQRWYGDLNMDGNNTLAKNYWEVVVESIRMDIFTAV